MIWLYTDMNILYAKRIELNDIVSLVQLVRFLVL
jgi:hypothetical protein